MAHEFFRIVRGSRPTLEDFKSLRALGRPRSRNPRHERERAEGISVYDDFAHACEMARANRFRHGAYIVRLVVPDDGSVGFRQTFAEHHYTIYTEPADILAYAEDGSVQIPEAHGD